MKKISVLSIFIVLLWQSTGIAYDTERAMNNFAHELADCAAFYMLSSKAPGLDESTSKKLLDGGLVFSELSAKFTNEKLALARFELAVESMGREMENNWSNFSILLNKYGYPCKDLLENPEAKLQHWLNKKD